jgi:hypothetical protein
MKNKLKIERVNELLEYQSLTGKFYWKVYRSRSAKAGDEAGCLRKDGCFTIKLDGVSYLSHRLVWFIEKGRWPFESIDHINGNRGDNRIENLRDVSHRINHHNCKKAQRTDPSLPTGVAVHRRNGKVYGYRATWVGASGRNCFKYFNLSDYVTHEAAIKAASAYRMTCVITQNQNGAGYTQRHGK